MSIAPQQPAKRPIPPQGPAQPKPPAPARPSSDPTVRLRRGIYAILITISVGSMTGRIAAVNSVDVIRSEARLKSEAIDQEKQKLQGSKQAAAMTDRELEDLTRADWQKQRPFLSANDRSRWLTIRALVEHGAFAIDEYVTDPKTYPNWDTIDMVMHVDVDGTPHLYSSKPPLLSMLYAGPYWLAYKLTGAIRGTPITLSTHPYEIGRTIVWIVNVLPLIIYFWIISKSVERYGRTNWGRVFMVAAATFGTFITTFAVVLNNHLPAAVSAMIALYPALRIWYDGERRARYFLVAGFFAAFTAACELPALSFFALLSIALLFRAPRQTLLLYLPPAAIVIAGFFAANWFAHHSLIPPYAHRLHNNPSVAADNQPTTPSVTPPTPAAANPTPTATNSSPATTAAPVADADHYEGTLKLPTGQTVTLRGNTKNWYDYEFTRTDGKLVQSYWRHPEGIDIGEQSIGKYALNVLVGHHGIFSLTPLWLLILPGLLVMAFGAEYRMPALSASIALISITCITFFILLPVDERNYGGMTSGFRWVFWLTPLWLLAVLPAADKLSRWLVGRLLSYLLLALSVLSASYPVWNPWVQPWLWNLWSYLGW